ncbi:MAG TPA: hypothetical protein VI316_08195, partial [Candidatus Dormibacteraeota bacterium]
MTVVGASHQQPPLHAARDDSPAPGHALPPDLTTGCVILDIGGETGALVIHTGADRLGDEIEVTRLDGAGMPTHVAVLKRRISGGVAHAAVFSTLREGTYQIHGAGPSCPGRAHVMAGGVAEVDWRAAERTS